MNIPNRTDLITAWYQAAQDDTILTAKHDPSGLGIAWGKPRSVLVPGLADNLTGFFGSGYYDIKVYSDTQHPHGSGYFEVSPKPESNFSVIGSGVDSGSLTPNGALNRLIVVYGPVQKWHVYAESDQIIQGSIVSGRFALEATL